MKNILRSRGRRFPRTVAAAALVGLCLVLLAAGAGADICDAALLRCLGDAAALFSEGSVIGGLAYAAFCFEGYTFCREFLQE